MLYIIVIVLCVRVCVWSQNDVTKGKAAIETGENKYCLLLRDTSPQRVEGIILKIFALWDNVTGYP